MNNIDDNARAQSGQPVRDPEEAAAAAATPGLLCFADIDPLDVEWLWQGRLPAGMVAVLDGPPAAGKSTIVADLAARISTGRPLPGETGARPPADVLLLGCEDSPAHTVRPRLDAAGADVRRVHMLDEIDGGIRLPDDVGRLEDIVREIGARLVVIDPLSAYIGKVDFHRDNEVRTALTPLAGLSERTGAVVLLLRHLRKSGGTDAIGRGLGSIAISAVARTVMLLLADQDDASSMVLAWAKLSVGRLPSSLRWSRTDVDGVPRIQWGTECPLSANEILARHDERHSNGSKAREATALDAAVQWLMALLEGLGAVETDEIKRRAAADGLSWRTVERAKAQLGVRAWHVGRAGESGGGHWVWVAPGLPQAANGDGDRTAGGEGPAKAAEGQSLAALVVDRPVRAGKLSKSRGGGAKTNPAKLKTAKPDVAVLPPTDNGSSDDVQPRPGVSSDEATR